MSPLGTLRSWTLHAALAGALLPPVAASGGVLTTLLLDGRSPGHRGFEALATAVPLGAALGLVLGPLAWWAASALWRVPLMAFALGPVLGALYAWALMGLLLWWMDANGPLQSASEWLIVLGMAAFTLAPPWVGYVAVRSRGRSGWPVVLASFLWVLASGILLASWYSMHVHGWLP